MNRLYIQITAFLIAFLTWGISHSFVLADSLEIIELDTMVRSTSDCEGETEVCLDVVFQQLRNYEIFVDGSPYAGRFPACNIDTIYKVNFDNVIDNATPPFELLFFEVDGELFQVTFNDFKELVDSVRIWDPTSDWKYDSLNNEMFTINPPQILFSNVLSFRDLSGNITITPVDQTFRANGTFFFFNTGWSEAVFRDTMNNCVDTVDIGIYCPSVDTVFISIDWMQRDSYCFNSTGLLGIVDSIEQLDLASGDQLDWSETDSCLVFTGTSEGMDTLTYKLIDDLGFCDTQVVIIEVGEMPNGSNEIIRDTLFPSQRDTFCLDPLFTVDALRNLCPESSGSEIAFSYDTINNCIIYEYLLNGTDSFCLELTYDNQIRDSFTFHITGSAPIPETLRDSLFLSETREYCLKTDELQGDSFRINIFCQDTVFTTYVIDSSTYCLEITGDSVGFSDSLCIELCDTSGLCDTSYFIIRVDENINESEFFVDTLLVNFMDTICLQNDLPGSLESVENICPDSLNTGVEFQFDTSNSCVIYSAVELQRDTACYVFRDDLGNTDTNYIVVQPLLPQKDTVFTFIDFLLTDTFCLDSSELAGIIISIGNICPENASGQVDFTVDSSTNCISYTGLQTGVDTACIVLCDSFGVCDTTIIITEVGEMPTGDNTILTDTLYPNQRDSFCFDFEFGAVDTIVDNCESLNGISTDFNLESESSCITYAYLQPGTDTACIEVIYENGIRDSFTFYITGLLPRTDTIFDTLFVNNSNEYCLDLSELAGPVDSAIQYCSDSTVAISLDTIDQNLCFNAEGLTSGATDTLCWSYCDSFGVCDTTIYILSVENTVDTSEFIYDTILINFSDSICFDNDLPGELVSIENICPGISGPVLFSVDEDEFCLFYFAESVGVDTACILLTDEFGNTDTNFVVITSMRPSADTIFLTIPVNVTDTTCIDDSELAGTVNTMINVCPELVGEDVEATLLPGMCIEYTGLVPGGIDTMCILICDDLGICDTVIYILQVEQDSMIQGRDSLIVDSILINFTETICFDTLDIYGSVTSITNTCPEQEGQVEFFLDQDQYCLSFTGDSLGVDTACIVIEYENGPRDSFTVIVRTVPPSPDTTFLSLDTGMQLDTCVTNPTEELAGFLQGETVQDVCPDANGDNSNIVIDTTTLCIEVIGLAEGQDTLCLVYCDNSNICDTSVFIITVTDTIGDSLDPPVAVDDQDITGQNTMRVINVLGNDTIPGNTLTSFRVLGMPNNGSVTFDTSGLVMYFPNEEFCGTDSFNYEICNEVGCDTATVTIVVECDEELFIPEGFSPNGDNIGDTWFIEGQEEFPNTRVEVFNRWGNRVFLSNEYQNDWDGTWEGDPLPDGTYFYLIDFRNGEQPRSGFVVILR